MHRALHTVLAGLVVTTSGCLALGGKTTYVQESPETQNRLAMLEAKVRSLEAAIYPPSSAPPVPPADFTLPE